MGLAEQAWPETLPWGFLVSSYSTEWASVTAKFTVNTLGKKIFIFTCSNYWMIKKAFEIDSVSEAWKNKIIKKQLELVLQNWAGTLILEGP